MNWKCKGIVAAGVGVIVLCIISAAYEFYELGERLSKIENGCMLRDSALHDNSSISKKSVRRSGKTSAGIYSEPGKDFSVNHGKAQIKILVKDLACVERDFYTLYFAVVPGSASASWTLLLVDDDGEIGSYENIEWMIEGSSKHLFRWDEPAKRLEFIGREYDKDGVNEYFVAIGAWDKMTYQSHEIVLSVAVKNQACL